MANLIQGFPDDRDLQLQREAEQTSQMADDLVEWAGQFVQPRKGCDFEVTPDEEFLLYRLRRLASNLCRSANVPVAAAFYGASQVGKSLFVGNVLTPADTRDSPLGKCDQVGPPAYFRELSFHLDINPNSGSNEATALVTRFTTKERFDEKALPEFPVKVRALSRAEWLRVMARGFRSECVQPMNITWREPQLRALFDEVSRQHAADDVDRDWRMDLLDVYAYLRSLDPRLYEVTESMFNSFSSKYPLSDAGYVEIAGQMFSGPEELPRVDAVVQRRVYFHREDHRRGARRHPRALGGGEIPAGQPAVARHRDLRLEVDQEGAVEGPQRRFPRRVVRAGLQARRRRPKEDQAIIQSAMLEMIVPVVPHRLREDWREVILKMDLLDLPGMRSGRGEGAGGAGAIDSTEKKMNVVKRGKVFYLIDRYIEERQVQTLLLLVRGGNLEVRQLLKDYIDKWGRSRYGEDQWPGKVADSLPALFIGMTGIDEEFKDRDVNHGLYDHRLTQLVNHTLHEIMTSFGAPNQPFTNVYPIRYPGTWDFEEARRQAAGPGKWDEAGKVFVESAKVQTYVRDAAEKWQVAMRDGDGGQSLISRGFIACTTALQKQELLQGQICKVREDLRSLAERWFCNPDVNVDRDARQAVGKRVLKWLDDEEQVYSRVRALQTALCFEEGDAMEVAEFAENRSTRNRTQPRAIEQRFPEFLKTFLGRWARELATERWREHVANNDGGGDWLPAEDFALFARFLCDYLCCGSAFNELSTQLLDIVGLAVRDEGDRRHAQREYVRVILNDFVLNPGSGNAALEPVPTDGAPACGSRDFGLMDSFVRRWQGRMPLSLASAAGAHVKIPAGNAELGVLLRRS